MKKQLATLLSARALASSYLMLAVLHTPLAFASPERDASEVFSAAVGGGFTFNGQRVVDDVSLSFLHYTKAGRAALINELERTRVIYQLIGKKGALRAFSQANKFSATKRVGPSGLDEYMVRGEMELQWSVCDISSCVPSGPRNKVSVQGLVIPVTAFGRPAYKVDSLTVSEVGK